MGHFNQFNVQFDLNPPPVPGTKLIIKADPGPLSVLGFNIHVELSTAGVFRKLPNPVPLSSIVVMAHFDTGAASTSIDINLAKHLNLVSIGTSTRYTAGGPQKTPDFYIDLSFPGSALRSFQNLKIGSCVLPFDLNKGINPRNFGILIGRDIMSKWNIIWNGPTSTVFIND